MAKYSVVAVQRIPQQLSGPTLTELGPLEASVKWVDILDDAPEATLGLDINSVQSDIKEALRDLSAQPLEAWIYRNDEIVFAGPIIGGEVKGKSSLSLTARGLEYYTRYMLVYLDKTWTAEDQFVIVKEMVDDWQDLDYGDFGINTVTVGTSGITRDLIIPGVTEPREVLEAITELGALDNGFDFWVDPDTRELMLGVRGSDLSAGVFLERGVQSPAIQFAVPPNQLASELFATGTSPDSAPITTTKSNAALRQSFGRAGAAVTIDGIGVLADLEDAGQAELDARANTIFLPGPGVVPVAGAGVRDFGVGDTVTYTFDAGLGLQTGAYRVYKRQVSVSDEGQETMNVEFL